MADGEVVARSRFQVTLNVALRIDDYGGASHFVTDEVRSVSEAVEIELFEDHALVMFAQARPK